MTRIPITQHYVVHLEIKIGKKKYKCEAWILDDLFWLKSSRSEALCQLMRWEDIHEFELENFVRDKKSSFFAIIKKSVAENATPEDIHNLMLHEAMHFHLGHKGDSTPEMEKEVDENLGPEIAEENYRFGMRVLMVNRMRGKLPLESFDTDLCLD